MEWFLYTSPPLEILGNIWRHFWLSQLGNAISIWWVEARDAAKHFIVLRTTPTTKDYLAPNLNIAKVGKPCVRARPLKGYLLTSSLRNTQEPVGNSDSQAIPRPTWVIISLLTRSPGDSYTHQSLRSNGPEQNLSGLGLSVCRVSDWRAILGIEDHEFGSNRESMAWGRKTWKPAQYRAIGSKGKAGKEIGEESSGRATSGSSDHEDLRRAWIPLACSPLREVGRKLLKEPQLWTHTFVTIRDHSV